MNEQDKLYGLMAQVEELQAHAQQLQNEAQKTFKELPLAVAQASKEIKRRGLIQALFVVAVGVVVAVIAWAVVYWITTNARAEYAHLKKNIATLEETERLLTSKTWEIELAVWKNERGIILPKGTRFIRSGETDDGRIGIVISK